MGEIFCVLSARWNWVCMYTVQPRAPLELIQRNSPPELEVVPFSFRFGAGGRHVCGGGVWLSFRSGCVVLLAGFAGIPTVLPWDLGV